MPGIIFPPPKKTRCMRELRDGTPANPAFHTCFPAPISIKNCAVRPLRALHGGRPRSKLGCGCRETLKYRLTLILIEKQPQTPPSNAGAAGALRAGPGSFAAAAQSAGRPRSSVRGLAALSSGPGALTGERPVAPRHRPSIRASGAPHAPLAGQGPGRLREGIGPGPARPLTHKMATAAPLPLRPPGRHSRRPGSAALRSIRTRRTAA